MSKNAKIKRVIDTTERSIAKEKLMEMGDGKVALDIYHMHKSRYRILYISSYEEIRVINYFKQLSILEGHDLFQWDCSRGLRDAFSQEKAETDGDEVHENPVALLSHIVDKAKSDFEGVANKQLSSEGSVFLLLDFHRFLDDPLTGKEGNPAIERLLKEFSQIISLCMIVIVSPVVTCSPSLEKEITIVDFPLPSKKEITRTLDKLLKDIPEKYPEAIKSAHEKREEIIHSVSGLTLVEAENALAKSLVKSQRFDIDIILEEKRQMIRKTGILEYREPRYTLDDIGGLENLKKWILTHKMAFKDDAREYGLAIPRGILLCGTSGCGKSLACDALASAYEMPLLRLDFGAIFGSLLGESERNLRKCLKVVEGAAPCVVGATNIVIDNLLTTIEDFFNNEIINDDNEISTFNNQYTKHQTVVYISKDRNINILGSKNNCIIHLKVKAVIRTYKQCDLIKIKTKSGREIIATEDHLLADENGCMKRMKDFKEKDAISIVYNNSIQGDKGERCYKKGQKL